MEFCRLFPSKYEICVQIPFKPTRGIRCCSSFECMCVLFWSGDGHLAVLLSVRERADSCALLSSESRVWDFTRWQRQMTAERMQPAGRTPPYLTPPRLDHPFRKPSAITLFSYSLSLSLYYSHNFKLLYWHCCFAYIYCPIKYWNTE